MVEPAIDLYWFLPSDPRVGAGQVAPLSQLLIRTDDNTIFYKSGGLPTDWTQIGGAGPGVGMAIGAPVIGGTTGSILFIGAATVLAQDNARLFWDDAANRLGVGTATPGFAIAAHDATALNSNDVIEARNLSASGYSSVRYVDDTGTQRMALGFANAAAPIARLRGKNYLHGAAEFSFDDATAIALTVIPTAAGCGMQFATGGALAVSDVNTGRVRYNSAGQKFQISANGAAYVDVATGSGMAIGGTVTGATVGSILFAATGPVLAQDNAALFWDSTNKWLGIGINAPLYTLDVVGTPIGTDEEVVRLRSADATKLSAIRYDDNTGAFKLGLGYSTPDGVSYADIRFSDFVFIGLGIPDGIRFIGGANALQMGDGSAAAVSAANTGRIIYNPTGQKFQISANGAGYLDVCMPVTALTTSSVPFANSAGKLDQDNARFFWNNTNKHLRVLTDHATDSPLFVRSTVTTGPSAYGTHDSAGAFKSYWGFFNSAYAFAYLQSKHGVLCFDNANFILGNSTIAQFEFGMTAGSGFLMFNSGAGAAVSAAGTCRLRYNAATNFLQISKNGAAYANVA